jgi:hypothetical protein
VSDKALREALERLVAAMDTHGSWSLQVTEALTRARQALTAEQMPAALVEKLGDEALVTLMERLEGEFDRRHAAASVAVPPRPAPTEEMVERGAKALMDLEYPEAERRRGSEGFDEAFVLNRCRKNARTVLTAALQEPGK